MTRSGAKKSSDGKDSQQLRKKSAVKSLPTADMIRKVTEKTYKTSVWISDRQAVEWKRTVLSGLDERLSGILPPGYTELSMSADAMSRSSIRDYPRLPWSCKLGADNRYERKPGLHAFLFEIRIA